MAVSTVSKKEIGRCFKLILKTHDTNVDIIQTGDFMNRFCGNLGLSRDIQKAATAIAQRSVDLDLVNFFSKVKLSSHYAPDIFKL